MNYLLFTYLSPPPSDPLTRLMWQWASEGECEGGETEACSSLWALLVELSWAGLGWCLFLRTCRSSHHQTRHWMDGIFCSLNKGRALIDGWQFINRVRAGQAVNVVSRSIPQTVPMPPRRRECRTKLMNVDRTRRRRRWPRKERRDGRKVFFYS